MVIYFVDFIDVPKCTVIGFTWITHRHNVKYEWQSWLRPSKTKILWNNQASSFHANCDVIIFVNDHPHFMSVMNPKITVFNILFTIISNKSSKNKIIIFRWSSQSGLALSSRLAKKVKFSFIKRIVNFNSTIFNKNVVLLQFSE